MKLEGIGTLANLHKSNETYYYVVYRRTMQIRLA